MNERAIDEVINSPLTRPLLETYFDPDSPFAGITFDTVGENPPDRFTAGDLLAVSLLDVRLRPPAVRALLAGGLDDQLAAIDPQQPLWEADERVLDLADRLWTVLVRSKGVYNGVGPTIASKLLSRKRPALVPIADSVILAQLKPEPGGLWRDLAAVLTRARRDGLRRLSPADCDVTELRVLDVAMWMTHSQSRNAKAARRAAAKSLA